MRKSYLDKFDRQRTAMVATQIAGRGIASAAVLRAMGAVRRERYVDGRLSAAAYEDTVLPIMGARVVAQPYVVARIVEALDLRETDRVLEIGTGSGYTAAVMAEIAAAVFTIEGHEELTVIAASRLARDGYSNARVRQGDGALGWPQVAPFDAIVVASGGPATPDPLVEQLAVGGRLLVLVQEIPERQKLIRITRVSTECCRVEELADVRFVPAADACTWQETSTTTHRPGEHRASRR